MCERQFKSEVHLGKHLEKSDLHKENLAKAVAIGRLTQPSKRPAEGPAETSDAVEPSAKRERLVAPTEAPNPASDSGSSSVAASSAAPMSALEQMELFEKRLKSQAKMQPQKKAATTADVDSNKARTINNQMDWECGECGQFNFARSVICHACKAHVDHNTKYLSNRLKELKQERFARVFGNSATAPPGGKPFVADPAAEHAFQKSKLTADNNVGHQMLSGMGWRGGGLGRGQDGVSEPVRAAGASAGDGDSRRASFNQ